MTAAVDPVEPAPPVREAPFEPAATGVKDLLALFDLKGLGGDRFLAPNPPAAERLRLYGGQVAAQALMAAGMTAPEGRRPHSIHCYFLRGGRHDVPAEHEVQRVRDGRSFSVRRVVTRQGGQEIFTAACSFHVDEPGPQHQAMDLPLGVPDPDTMPEQPRIGHNQMFEVRHVHAEPTRDGWAAVSRLWARTRGSMPDDDLLHAVAVCYLTDMGWAFGSLLEGGGPSIDHAVWFHQPARADEWMLVDLRPLVARGARGLYVGTVHERSGAVVATIAQEALIRSGRWPEKASTPVGN